MASVKSTADCEDSIEFRRVGYFPNWAPYRQGNGHYDVDNIDPAHFTHLIYAFAVLNRETYEIEAFNKEYDINRAGYRRFNELKKRNPNLKTLIAIGGWVDSQSSTKYSELVSDPARIAHFVEQATCFVKEHGFDGLDFGWEYPCEPGVPEDRERLINLLAALKESFAPGNLLLTIPVSCRKSMVGINYNVAAIADAVDFVNLMTYDMHGSWENNVDHHAPFKRRPIDGPNADVIVESVDVWLKNGIPSGKLVLGLPAYGRSFSLNDPGVNRLKARATGPGPAGTFTNEAGFMAFYEIGRLLGEDGWTVVTDPNKAMGPYAFKGNTWIAWDDVAMIQEKVKYALNKELGGVMLWDISMDDFNNSCNLGPCPITSTVMKTIDSSDGL